MLVSRKMAEAASSSSWIRQMFEEGSRLARLYGPQSVFDFSIGNPNVEPPAEFHEILREIVADPTPGKHGYMSNAGYEETRRAVASRVSQEQGVSLTGDHVVMTVGAAGALNVILKAILDPGDEVVVPAPYFVEYGFYVDNHGGILKPVSSTPDFDLDLDAIDQAITPRTRAVLLNMPNNPTGRVYSTDTLRQLGELLTERSESLGRVIYLVSDEPYRRIVYDGVQVPAVMSAYPYALVASSYSKELSLAGERIGYAAASPLIPGVEELMGALVTANRILGFVNAPALMQRVVARLEGIQVDISLYRRNRDVLWQGLTDAGYQVVKPQGAFYLFPRCPIEDDVAFCRAMLEHLVLAVPGRGFGLPGYFRLAYCVSPDVVDGALPLFRKVAAKYWG
ncbi:MAG: pyridoxal phosphate-dependent aminotransferase [Thermoleophilia bacterium]|nr:pyridoxal phosphate-dependent aminotransferase [Thermoleophilia bacterium]